MSAIDSLFTRLREREQTALMPFLTAGDPDLDFTADALRRLDATGCHLMELGVPYSDPIADGPVIQASYTRALEKQIKLKAIFEMAGDVLPALAAPVAAMVSYAIIHRWGPRRFIQDARAAGFAGAIVPDLLVEESGELAEICRDAGFSLIQLVTPTTPRERAVRIAGRSSGFVYYVSVTGITGERSQLPDDLVENVTWLRGQTELPICIGFGVSRPEHAKALAPVADGIIVGSAIVRRIAQAETKPREEVLDDVAEYVRELIEALAT